MNEKFDQTLESPKLKILQPKKCLDKYTTKMS